MNRPSIPDDRDPPPRDPAPTEEDRLRDAADRDAESGRNSGRGADETRQATL